MALGKSLGSILDDYFGTDQAQLRSSDPTGQVNIAYTTKIPLSQIEYNPWQTRTEFDKTKIQKLAEDIKVNGLIQPILVIAKKPNDPTGKKFRLLAGERRLRATMLLNQNDILATVRPMNSLNASQQAFISAMENLQREDLNPIDLGKTFQLLIESHEDMTEDTLAEKLGSSTQHIKNHIRLLTLGDKVKDALKKGKLREGHARHLVGLDIERQNQILEEIIANNLTVKEVARLVGKKKIVKVRIVNKEKHEIPPEIVQKITRLAAEFPRAKIKFTGNPEQGKIQISWKKWKAVKEEVQSNPKHTIQKNEHNTHNINKNNKLEIPKKLSNNNQDKYNQVNDNYIDKEFQNLKSNISINTTEIED